MLNQFRVMRSLLFLSAVSVSVSATSHFKHSLTLRGPPMLVSHSFASPDFGPAQNTHGCTFTPRVSFLTNDLHPTNNWVIDIGLAGELLAEVCSRYHLCDLNQICEGEVTTTEWMAMRIHGDLKQKLTEGGGLQGQREGDGEGE